jgi:hypothetical protein
MIRQAFDAPREPRAGVRLLAVLDCLLFDVCNPYRCAANCNSRWTSFSPNRISVPQGSIPRINAILVFEGAPGQRLGEYSLRKFFGRELGDAKAA